MTVNDSAKGVRRVIRDFIDLAELQIQLISVDSQEARRKGTTAAAFVGIAGALGASMLTVLLIALGFLIHEQAGLPVGISLLLVCGVTLVIIVFLGWMAARLIRTATAAMAETKSEFAENLRWIKATLLKPETSARNRIRAESFNEHGSVNGRPGVPNATTR